MTVTETQTLQVATKVVVRAMEEAAQPYWEEDEDQSCRSSQDTGSVILNVFYCHLHAS